MNRAKEFLKQYKYAVMEAERCKEQYQQTTEKVDSIRSTLGGDGMPHGSEINRGVEDLAIRLTEAANRYLEAEERAQIVKEEVEDMLNSLPVGMPGQVLYERYINLTKWDTIAGLFHYSLRAIFKLHEQGLKLVEVRLNDKG